MDKAQYTDILFKKEENMSEFEKTIYNFPTATTTLSKLETEETRIKRKITRYLTEIRTCIDRAVVLNQRSMSYMISYDTSEQRSTVDELTDILDYLGYTVAIHKKISKGLVSTSEFVELKIQW